MADPSERFSERLDCGCDLHAGSWDYCAAHRVSARPVTAAALSEIPKALAQPEERAPWEAAP